VGEEVSAHVVVDEYQDLNKCEIEVVRQLIDPGRKLFAAGDDDQSIYGFRNAYPVGLRRFDETYPEGATEEELEECYRCDKAIVELAKAVIEQDVDRIPKEWEALDTAADGSIRANRFGSISAEARGVASLAEELIGDGVAAESILVLLRNDPQGVYSRPLIEAMPPATFTLNWLRIHTRC
jgi:DNA helicase-2/ATP-dependent DNA helicase PcrA